MLYAFLALTWLASWGLAFHFVIWPKLLTYKLTAGITGKIAVWEGGVVGKIALRLKGSKVAILGLLGSAAPVFGPMLASLGGMNWGAVFPTEKAATIAFVIAAITAAAPLIMTILHGLGMAEAVQIDPAAPVIPPVPVTPVAPASAGKE